nr:MAG TPA: hypothetical protein [Caudoviricetes sp.]
MGRKMVFSDNKSRFYTCTRCGETKDWYRFRDGQPYWCYQCVRCEKTPVGQMPIPQLPEHSVPH